MNIRSLGLISAAVSNTPVPLAIVPTPCQKIVFAQVPGSSAVVFIGTLSMNTSSGTGVFAALLPAAASGISQTWEVGEPGNEVDAAEFAIASGTIGAGAYVSLQVE